ncbi:MAG: YegS/Rv2252/BmrU family lipid kinase [Oscillospiraceae bacterium]|jgi:YegS/Rv2252/BmrU family lipid kinase|nr:YegS/Rv2252/BmrU family lipid kinase [Oscillospiraceae bacterium]
MAQSMMLIINPHSGRGLSKTALGTIVSSLCDAEHTVTVYISRDKKPQDLIYQNAKKHDLVVCVGGDGTLHDVISGLLRAGVTIPVGYIPAGTSNDVAITLALSKDPSKAAQQIINGAPRALDIGKFHDRYFTYLAAFGAFTGVSYNTPQSAKNALGHFAYVLGGIADVAAIKPRHTVIEYDGKTTEGEFIFGAVTNSTSVAGFIKIAPGHVDLADGLFEIILVKQPIVLADFMDIMSGLAVQKYDGDNVQILHASSVRFYFEEEVAWTIDGEDGGKHKKVEITNYHKAIEIVM